LKTIRGKIFLSMIFLTVVIFASLWLMQIVFLNKFYSIIEVGSFKSDTEILINEIEETSIESAKDKIEDYIYKHQSSLEIVDSDLNVIYKDSPTMTSFMPGMFKENILSAYNSALKGVEYSEEITHPRNGIKSLLLAYPIYDGEEIKSALMVTFPLASIEETVSILKVQLFIITIIILILSIIITYFISNNLSRPLKKIIKQAKEYELSNYSYKNEVKNQDEISSLMLIMNSMGDNLHKNDLLQKELISNTSHELRTPLTLIRGYAETIKDVTGNNEEKRNKQLDIIIDETKRLSKIVDDILDFSKIQAGISNFKVGSFLLSELINEIKEKFEEDNLNLEIIVKYRSNNILNVLADRDKIAQVLYNLISNAVNHTNNNKINIIVEENLDDVIVKVQDFGDGILEEDIPHIFERYYKGNNSKGYGLGLAIVKAILENHGFNYGIESEKDIGTIFYFSLKKSD